MKQTKIWQPSALAIEANSRQATVRAIAVRSRSCHRFFSCVDSRFSAMKLFNLKIFTAKCLLARFYRCGLMLTVLAFCCSMTVVGSVTDAADDSVQNIALNRAAYQSSSVDDDHTAHLATDGHDETYWESQPVAARGSPWIWASRVHSIKSHYIGVNVLRQVFGCKLPTKVCIHKTGRIYLK